ncbi:MAG TPA: 4-alpha-glucanotransferase, partial [Vicinamibacteria bacterium]|nr:4-alpha-glucanotransferase [Vicinamibacteria bacterium]
MTFRRSSGLLLHPTSLPGPHGVGDLGPAAHRFADFLVAAGQKMWQVLPLGPTGYGESPYQCFSAFAGNPVLISLEQLAEEGWLEEADLQGAPAFPDREADYEGAAAFKQPLLDRAYDRFAAAGGAAPEDFSAFCAGQGAWLDDFALFVAVKAAHGGAAWTDWDRGIAGRQPQAMERWRQEQGDRIARVKFQQFVFFRQWQALREHCARSGIRLFGDVPIFVAHDSADVWAHPELFRLREDGRPEVVAGVPPDYFSATGQLWGNPLYRWEEMARVGYGWWVERLRAALQQVDLVRLDHFRGFEAYWEVPADETTAVNGRWVKGPGAALFEALQRELGDLPLVAENLGVITPEVEALRRQFDLPGMVVLHFAFSGPDNRFLPHHHERNAVIYPGTHDNDTTVGWWGAMPGHEREFLRRYAPWVGHDIAREMVRMAWQSVA